MSRQIWCLVLAAVGPSVVQWNCQTMKKVEDVESGAHGPTHGKLRSGPSRLHLLLKCTLAHTLRHRVSVCWHVDVVDLLAAPVTK